MKRLIIGKLEKFFGREDEQKQRRKKGALWQAMAIKFEDILQKNEEKMRKRKLNRKKM